MSGIPVFWSCPVGSSHNFGFLCSYDLDLDQRLSEETTVLVESYTVRAPIPFVLIGTDQAIVPLYSSQTDGQSKSGQSVSRPQNACSSPI